MAESDTPRLNLRRWSDGSDTPSRVEFDTAHANIDNLAAIDKQDTFVNRPAPGVRGTYFWDTTNSLLWRDTGSEWTVVGSKVRDGLAVASAPASVPFTAQGVVGQTADLFQAKVGTEVRAFITAGGSFSGASFLGRSVDVRNTVPGNPVIFGRGAAGQTGDLLSLASNDNTNMFKVKPDGSIEGAFFSASSGRGIVGARTMSNVSGMNTFGGLPSFEIYTNDGGSGGFSDFLYIKHQAADATAVSRKLGILLKVGDEIPGDASKSGGLYIQSSNASFTNPTLTLFRGDQDVMRFRAGAAAQILSGLELSGTLVVPGSGEASIHLDPSKNGRIGMQGNSVYFRSGSSGNFYFYSTGNHSDSPGDSGGGSTLGVLDSGGKLTVTRVNITSTSDASPGASSPPFMIGSASGENLIIDTNEIMARNNGATAGLLLNGDGGDVTIGNASDGSIVNVRGTFRINGRTLTIATSAPSNPATGDVWIDI